MCLRNLGQMHAEDNRGSTGVLECCCHMISSRRTLTHVYMSCSESSKWWSWTFIEKFENISNISSVSGPSIRQFNIVCDIPVATLRSFPYVWFNFRITCKKYSDSQCCWKKYILILVEEAKNNLIQSFCHIT
jgi:hypothetical protein